MRGDEPYIPEEARVPLNMYPTCVGMNRYRTMYLQGRRNVPHMRGDEPKITAHHGLIPTNVPHMRGDEPDQAEILLDQDLMYPTCVGMNRVSTGSS